MKKLSFLIISILISTALNAQTEDIVRDFFGTMIYGDEYVAARAFSQGFKMATDHTEPAVPDGYHKITYANGKYEGYFKNGKRNGKGTYIYADGEKYVGNWKNGLKHGKGTLITANNYKFVGDFVNDQINGKGKLTLPDGSWAIGEFVAGNAHGECTYYIPSEKRYVKALFENNQPVQIIEEGSYNPSVKKTSTIKKTTNTAAKGENTRKK